MDESRENKSKRPKWKLRIQKILDNYVVVTIMSLVTIYSLFFDDIRMLTTYLETDYICYDVTAAAFSLFATEIILGSICKENYFLTFFFWLDVVSTLSMLTDIGPIWDGMTGGGGSASASNAAKIAKTSRAGRVTRVIRVIRLIRLIRIVKLYK